MIGNSIQFNLSSSYFIYPNSISSYSQAYIFVEFLTSNWSSWILRLCPNLDNLLPYSFFFGCLLLPYIVLNVSFDLFIYFFHWHQILQFWQSLTANASHNNYLNLLPFKTKKSNISCTKLCIYIHATTNTYIQQNWLCYAYTKKIIHP